VSVSSNDRSKSRRKENVAILDHSYHAVLSHKVDTQLGLVLMESLANRRWLVRHTSSGGMVPGTLSHLSKIINIKETTDSKENSIKDSDNKRKYIKRKEKNGKIIRRKRKFDDDSRAGSPDIGGGPVLSVKDGSGVEKIRDRLSGDHKKKRKSSYDIDHIVIPMSMAATTRIDKIKYKEILTPSWREVKKAADEDEAVTVKVEIKKEEAEAADNNELEDSEFEDISDLAYKLRHVKAEDEERIRWATPLGRTHGGQRGHHGVSRRRTRRLDSCRTEASSGANTPNPLSPEAIEDIVVSTRPSSPAPDALDTPLVQDVSSPPASDQQMPTPVSHVAAGVRNRRRTSSQTKSRDSEPAAKSRDRNLSEASQESSRSSSPWTERPESLTPSWSQPWSLPWEKRCFPLSDEQVKDLESEDPVLPVSVQEIEQPNQTSSTSCQSRTTSRSRSRSVEVRLVKLKSESQLYRSDSIEEEVEGITPDNEWDTDNEDAIKDEVADDDPEYEPQQGKE